MCEINFAYCINGTLEAKDIDALIINTGKSVGYTNKDGFGFFNDKCKIYKRGKEFGSNDAKQAKQMFKDSKFIISHVRFKTSGEKSARNSHPFMNGRFIWLHNGVISDFEEIAAKFGLAGAKVDSEVICGVLHHFIDKGLSFKKAMRKTAQELSGSLSVFIYDKKERRLYYFRHTANFNMRLVKVGEKVMIFGATDEDNLKPLPYFSDCYGFWKQDYTYIAAKEPKEDILYCISDSGISEVCDLEFKPYSTACRNNFSRSGTGTFYYDAYGNCLNEDGQFVYEGNMVHKKGDVLSPAMPEPKPKIEHNVEGQYSEEEKELKNAVHFIEDYTWSMCGESIRLERTGKDLWEFVCDDSEQELICDEYFERCYEPTKPNEPKKNRTMTGETLINLFEEMIANEGEVI